MNQEHEFYMFVYGMNEDDAMFSEFMLSLKNEYYYSPEEINIYFDGTEEDIEAFMANYAEIFENEKAATSCYFDFIPTYKIITDKEKNEHLSYNLLTHMWEEIYNTVHYSKVKIIVEN